VLFAFDRDYTVDCAEDPGPVPLAWLKALKPSHLCWAIGNPKLGLEAGIATHHTIKELCANRGVHVEMPTVSVGHLHEKWHSNAEGKIRRMFRLSALYPDSCRVVVDDIDLSTMPGWLWVSPRGFVAPGLDFWLRLEAA